MKIRCQRSKKILRQAMKDDKDLHWDDVFHTIDIDEIESATMKLDLGI